LDAALCGRGGEPPLRGLGFWNSAAASRPYKSRHKHSLREPKNGTAEMMSREAPKAIPSGQSQALFARDPNRIDAFPASEQEQIRIVLAESLRAVVAQQLLRKREKGRAPAFEILLGSTALSNAIREAKTNLINNQIQTGKSKGMISMDQSLTELVRSNIVLPEEALDRAHDKESFKAMLAGLTASPRPASTP